MRGRLWYTLTPMGWEYLRLRCRRLLHKAERERATLLQRRRYDKLTEARDKFCECHECIARRSS